MPDMALDDRDARILAELQADGRLTNVELADRVALSPSPCLRRVKRLESDGIIRGYRALVDRDAVGLGLTVFVELRVDKHTAANADALQSEVEGLREVVACHMVSGEADFLLEVVVADLKAYERFLSEHLLTLPMVKDIHSNFVIRRVKTDAPLPLPAPGAE